MRGSSPRRLGDAIQTLLTSLGIHGKLKRYEVLDRWPEIVGVQIAQVTKADHLEGDKLFVRVTRSTWRNELLFLKKDLIDKINATMKQEIIKDIIFR
jgi:predicted nucleic acid-binding Zn ribbon protein